MRLFAHGAVVLSLIAALLAAGTAWAQLPVPEPESGVLLAMLAAAVRTVAYVALFVAAGGGLFLVQAVRDDMHLAQRLQPGLLWLALTAGIGSVADLGLHGARLASGVGGLFTGEAWVVGLASVRGLGASVLLIALGLLALGIAAHGRRGAAAVTLMGAATAAVAVGLASPEASRDSASLDLLVAALHAAAAGQVVGVLWPLIVALTTQPAARCSEIVRRLAWPVLTGAVLVAVSGAILSPAEALGGPATRYGAIWLAKVSAAILAAGLAFRGCRRLIPALQARRPEAWWGLRANLVYVGGLLAAIIHLSILLEFARAPHLIGPYLAVE